MLPSEWLKLRTFSHHQFSDPFELLAKKKAQGNRVSLCLPVLNEAATVGKIIKKLRKTLQDQIPLIDEIIVIDSGSVDGSQQIALQMGATLYRDYEILPELGNFPGKGENLWKSLYVSNGDIILWLDTDIRNMHPRFVLGLLGPLLYHREISFVKGFYRRPIKMNNKLFSTGGGRVTQLVVKPLFNLLFPSLTLFNQPLSGEYGGRRELLERVPFYTGYGVETGLLLDVEARFGLSCMAQVDLEVRVHRNQDLESLRKMAFGILRVLLTRAEQQGKIVLMDNLNSQLICVLKNEFNQFEIDFKDVNEVERSAMILCKEYQQKRQLTEEDLILLEEIQKKQNYPFASVSSLLDPGLIIMDGEASDKQVVLRELSALIVEHGFVRNYHELLDSFYRREKILSTGIGAGVAIPHVISPIVNRMKIAVYRKNNGIKYDSPDGHPVSLVIAVIAPKVRRHHYLQVLANLSMILKDENIRRRLLTAANPNDFIMIMRKVEVVKRIERELRTVEA